MSHKVSEVKAVDKKDEPSGTGEHWKHSCRNYSCVENSDGNCLVYSIWYKGTKKPNIEVCKNYEPLE